jgi:hypothetical protein
MTAIVQSVLALLTTLLPLIPTGGNAVLIESIISTLTNIMPFVVQEVETLVPVVKNIIAALQSSPATTESQLAALKALDQQADAAFDAAAADTDAETSAASGTPVPPIVQ